MRKAIAGLPLYSKEDYQEFWDMAAEITETIKVLGEYRRREGEALRARFERQALSDRIYELKDLCKQGFADALGFRIAKPFTLRALEENGPVNRRKSDPPTPSDVDHPSYYKSGSSYPYRAAAIACHIYGGEAGEANLRKAVESDSLACRSVLWFPSWHYPAGTKLFLLTPRSKKRWA